MWPLVLLIVAWGCLTFGAVYPWAWQPLIAAWAVAGAWGLLRRVPGVRRRVNTPVALGLLLVVLAIGVQLVPVSRATLMRISPAADEVLRRYDLAYALQVAPLLARAPAAGMPEPRQELRHPLSIDPPKTVRGLVFLGAFGVFLLGLARGFDGFDLRRFAGGLTVLGVLMALIGIVQKATWNGKIYGFWEPINKSFGAFGPFVNRNHFAGWMLMALGIALGLFAGQVARGMRGVEPTWRARLVWFSTPDANRVVLTGFSILAMGLALVMTLSRSGISGFALALLLSGFQVMRTQAAATRRRMLVGYLVLLAVVSVGWAGVDAIVDRFAQVDMQLGGRAGAWADAWRIHHLFPAVGTGFNTYGTATLFYQTVDVKLAHYVEAHNDYLQILAEGGLLVAVPVILLAGLFAREVTRRFREAQDDRTGYWLRVGAVTGILAIAMQEIVEFSLQMPGNTALFAVLCAIAIRRTSGSGGRARESGPGTRDDQGSRGSGAGRRF
jgi:O-Antigen ligase